MLKRFRSIPSQLCYIAHVISYKIIFYTVMQKCHAICSYYNVYSNYSHFTCNVATDKDSATDSKDKLFSC